MSCVCPFRQLPCGFSSYLFVGKPNEVPSPSLLSYLWKAFLHPCLCVLNRVLLGNHKALSKLVSNTKPSVRQVFPLLISDLL